MAHKKRRPRKRDTERKEGVGIGIGNITNRELPNLNMVLSDNTLTDDTPIEAVKGFGKIRADKYRVMNIKTVGELRKHLAKERKTETKKEKPEKVTKTKPVKTTAEDVYHLIKKGTGLTQLQLLEELPHISNKELDELIFDLHLEGQIFTTKEGVIKSVDELGKPKKELYTKEELLSTRVKPTKSEPKQPEIKTLADFEDTFRLMVKISDDVKADNKKGSKFTTDEIYELKVGKELIKMDEVDKRLEYDTDKRTQKNIPIQQFNQLVKEGKIEILGNRMNIIKNEMEEIKALETTIETSIKEDDIQTFEKAMDKYDSYLNTYYNNDQKLAEKYLQYLKSKKKLKPAITKEKSVVIPESFIQQEFTKIQDLRKANEFRHSEEDIISETDYTSTIQLLNQQQTALGKLIRDFEMESPTLENKTLFRLMKSENSNFNRAIKQWKREHKEFQQLQKSPDLKGLDKQRAIHSKKYHDLYTREKQLELLTLAKAEKAKKEELRSEIRAWYNKNRKKTSIKKPAVEEQLSELLGEEITESRKSDAWRRLESELDDNSELGKLHYAITYYESYPTYLAQEIVSYLQMQDELELNFSKQKTSSRANTEIEHIDNLAEMEKYEQEYDDQRDKIVEKYVNLSANNINRNLRLYRFLDLTKQQKTLDELSDRQQQVSDLYIKKNKEDDKIGRLIVKKLNYLTTKKERKEKAERIENFDKLNSNTMSLFKKGRTTYYKIDGVYYQKTIKAKSITETAYQKALEEFKTDRENVETNYLVKADKIDILALANEMYDTDEETKAKGIIKQDSYQKQAIMTREVTRFGVESPEKPTLIRTFTAIDKKDHKDQVYEIQLGENTQYYFKKPIDKFLASYGSNLTQVIEEDNLSQRGKYILAVNIDENHIFIVAPLAKEEVKEFKK